MGGIVGVVHFDGRPPSDDDLQILARPSRHRAVDGESRWLGTSAAMASLHCHVTPESVGERQPLIAPSGVALSFDGRLDNREEIIDACRVAGDRRRLSDARLVLAAYERYADRFVEHLNGDFALALHDPTLGRTFLACDRLGARSLFYSRL